MPGHCHPFSPTVRRRIVRVGAVPALLLAQSLAAQPQRAVTASKPPTATLQHVVEAADLQMSPVSATEGQPVRFRMKVKNTGATIAPMVPWRLEVDGQEIGGAVLRDLKAGESREFTKDWTARPGARVIRFSIDPNGTASVWGAPAAQRARQLSTSVVALPATEVRLIDWDAAKAVGMNYADGLQQPASCVAIVRPITNASYREGVPPAASADFSRHVGSIHIGLNCMYSGGRMNPVVFDNFQLRNGWKVKQVTIQTISQTRGTAGNPTTDWQYTTPPPAANSDRPRIALGIWSTPRAHLALALKVEIEGPRGTDPYR